MFSRSAFEKRQRDAHAKAHTADLPKVPNVPSTGGSVSGRSTPRGSTNSSPNKVNKSSNSGATPNKGSTNVQNDNINSAARTSSSKPSSPSKNQSFGEHPSTKATREYFATRAFRALQGTEEEPHPSAVKLRPDFDDADQFGSGSDRETAGAFIIKKGSGKGVGACSAAVSSAGLENAESRAEGKSMGSKGRGKDLEGFGKGYSSAEGVSSVSTTAGESGGEIPSEIYSTKNTIFNDADFAEFAGELSPAKREQLFLQKDVSDGGSSSEQERKSSNKPSTPRSNAKSVGGSESGKQGRDSNKKGGDVNNNTRIKPASTAQATPTRMTGPMLEQHLGRIATANSNIAHQAVSRSVQKTVGSNDIGASSRFPDASSSPGTSPDTSPGSAGSKSPGTKSKKWKEQNFFTHKDPMDLDNQRPQSPQSPRAHLQTKQRHSGRILKNTGSVIRGSEPVPQKDLNKPLEQAGMRLYLPQEKVWSLSVDRKLNRPKTEEEMEELYAKI